MSESRPRVLCVGGSDPQGGAGLQMDAAACAALRVDSACVAVMDTVQGDRGLESVTLHRAEEVARGMMRALEQGVHAVKLGALGNREHTAAVIETLEAWVEDGRMPLVIDPVAAATRSAAPEVVLNTPSGMRMLEERLYRYALVTPNAFEYGDGSRYAECLALLRKGGHAPDWEALAAGRTEESEGGEVVDFYSSVLGDELEFRHPRILGATGLHGTGCALASAIAALMARGYEHLGAVELGLDAMGQWLATSGEQLVPFPPVGGEWGSALT